MIQFAADDEESPLPEHEYVNISTEEHFQDIVCQNQ